MSFNNWRKNKPTNSDLAEQPLVSKCFLEESSSLPLVFKSAVPNLDLVNWYSKNQESVLTELSTYGAVLFRGFKIHSQEDFQKFVEVAIEKTAKYVEGATPRTQLTKGVYTATEFPSDQEIALHNELSYVTTPPKKLAFCCLKAAREGGQTQIADVGKVYARISPEIAEKFAQKGGWLLSRNYGTGFGPTVEKAFGMTDIESIKAYAKEVNLKLEQVSEEIIHTEQVRDAMHRHPVKGGELWFNHVSFWHPSSLCPKIREKMQETFSLSEFPYATYYGDGSTIDDETIEHIRQAYLQEEVKFNWREGDILLLDNWQVAHGRKPFKGERQVLVAMG